MSIANSVPEKTHVLSLLEQSKLFGDRQKKFLNLAWDKLPKANQTELFSLLEKETEYHKKHAEDLENNYRTLLQNAIARLTGVKRVVQRRLISSSESVQDSAKNPDQELMEALKDL